MERRLLILDVFQFDTLLLDTLCEVYLQILMKVLVTSPLVLMNS